MRTTILAAAAILLALPPAGPTLAQQDETRQPPLPQQEGRSTTSEGATPASGPDAGPIPGPTPAENAAGETNPAAATASGCGTTDAQLAKTPVGTNPCPSYPTPGSGAGN